MQIVKQRTFRRIWCGSSQMKFRAAAIGLVGGYFGIALLLAPRPIQADERQPAVSLTTLLAEMTDRDAAAKWPEPAFTLKESSSHDEQDQSGRPGHLALQRQPRSVHSDRGQRGPATTVLLDHDGPGTITRFWIPLLADKDKQMIRFYFDGSATPAIAVDFNELMSGKLFVRPPLAFVAWNETDLRQELQPSFKAPRGVAGGSCRFRSPKAARSRSTRFHSIT